jgi:O6-methylguanine-DNA--protein-cysteine methyltransferase
MLARLRELNKPVQAAIVRLAKALYGSARTANQQRVALAIVDIPYGAVRRYLVAGTSPPTYLRPYVERAIRAALHTNDEGRP